MKVAAQLFTLRDYLKTEQDIITTLKKVKDMGYDAVQISGIGVFSKEKVEIFKKECDKNHLEVVITHTNLPSLLNELDWVVEYHKIWNCKYVGVGMMPNEYTVSKEKLIEFANIMNEIGEKLAKHYITLVYHNHAFEFRKYGDKTGMDILLEHFNKYVQFEIDTYWVQKGGCNPVSWINKVKGKMDVIHFKDMGIKNWDEQFMEEVGSGNLEWDEIIKACLNNNVLYTCVEQDDTQGRDPFVCLSNSLNFLKNKGL